MNFIHINTITTSNHCQIVIRKQSCYKTIFLEDMKFIKHWSNDGKFVTYLYTIWTSFTMQVGWLISLRSCNMSTYWITSPILSRNHPNDKTGLCTFLLLLLNQEFLTIYFCHILSYCKRYSRLFLPIWWFCLVDKSACPTTVSYPCIFGS